MKLTLFNPIFHVETNEVYRMDVTAFEAQKYRVEDIEGFDTTSSEKLRGQVLFFEAKSCGVRSCFLHLMQNERPDPAAF